MNIPLKIIKQSLLALTIMAGLGCFRPATAAMDAARTVVSKVRETTREALDSRTGIALTAGAAIIGARIAVPFRANLGATRGNLGQLIAQFGLEFLIDVLAECIAMSSTKVATLLKISPKTLSARQRIIRNCLLAMPIAYLGAKNMNALLAELKKARQTNTAQHLLPLLRTIFEKNKISSSTKTGSSCGG